MTFRVKAIEQSFKVVVFSFSTFYKTKFGIFPLNLLTACESCLTSGDILLEVLQALGLAQT